MEEKVEATLLAAPIEFKRMLSWQLSAPTASPITKRKRKKKKQREDPVTDLPLLGVDGPLSDEDNQVDDDKTAEYAYIYVNSDGEEEVYYSAPESPLTSESDDESSAMDQQEQRVEHLEQSGGHRSKKSKKKKKKKCYLARVAKVEFFQPLCDLVEDNIHVEVGKLELSSCAQVPSLAEICIRKIRSETIDISGSLPFLIHSLLSQDREQRASVAIHLRWLERYLAEFEKLIAEDIRERKQSISHGYDPQVPAVERAFILQPTWDLTLPHNGLSVEGEGLHCPLPLVPDADYRVHRHSRIVTKILLHFANYIFPLFSSKGSRNLPVELSGTLSPSQLAAIRYVNDFIQSRYKSISSEWSEFLKVWPGYVYWARGQLKLAANAFVYSVNLLSHANDKACLLNELGRMFLMFGDRSSARRYFRQAALLAQPEGKQQIASMQVSAFALEASIWDCGLLTPSSAREATRAWSTVIKEASDISQFPWYLHLAACESRLCFHSGEPVGDDPSSPMASALPSLGEGNRQLSTRQWLKECRQLISGLVSEHPILNYYLSLVAALSGEKESCRTAWSNFLNNYYLSHMWPEWIRSGTSVQIFSDPVFTSHPWQPLLDMLTNQRLKCAPVMKLRWRLRLLQPYYPYFTSNTTMSMLVDHCATPPGLRLTRDGYLTGDFVMDMPPMRCVLIDPYTGALQFSHSVSLDHFTLHQMMPPVPCRSKAPIITIPDRFSLPWPQRLFDCEQFVVELLVTSTVDVESRCTSRLIMDGNYHASLHWYGSDGTQKKLDIRRLVRKQLRQKLWELAKETGLENKEDLLDKLMDHGRAVNIKDLNQAFRPKYTKVTDKHGKRKQRTSNHNVNDFHLMLTYHTIYGESTLVMCFNLNTKYFYNSNLPTIEHIHGQALVFVDCSSAKSFSQPKIYCVGDDFGFQHFYPDPTSCSTYQNNQFRHLKYFMAIMSESRPAGNKQPTSTQLVFDVSGNIVHSRQLDIDYSQHRFQVDYAVISNKEKWYSVVLGGRLFTWRNIEGSTDVEVYSYNLEGRNEYKSGQFEANYEALKFTAIPGLLFLHTKRGLALLNPGTLYLELIQIEGSTTTLSTPGDSADYTFKIDGVHFSILKVWNVGTDREESAGQTSEKEDLSETVKSPSSDSQEVEGELYELPPNEGGEIDAPLDLGAWSSDGGWKSGSEFEFGSCVAAFTVNNRLLVIKVKPRNGVYLVIDVALPGKATEIHPMGSSGYMVSVTQCLDHFREEIYWLSETGQLLGVLPAVGRGPRGFFSVTLDKSSKPSSSSVSGGDEDGDDGGLFVFFDDGMGGIACLRPTV